MNQDSPELIKYLDEKFKGVAKKEDLDSLALKLVTFEEFDKFKKEIKEEFNLLRESVQALTISVDKLVKAVSDLKTEYAAITLKIDRHEKWIQQLAEKLGVNLEY